jgi:hypothetical protein
VWEWLLGTPREFESRRVRLHFKNENRSLEGVWVGMAAGHYRIAKPEQIEAVDRTLELEGEAWVPREDVMLLQVLS